MTQEDFDEAVFNFLANNLFLDEETTYGAYSSNRKIILKLSKPGSYTSVTLGEINFDNPESKVKGYWDDD